MANQANFSLAKNLPGWRVILFNITTANTATRLSQDDPITDGVAVVVRARPSNTAEAYAAPTADDVAGGSRIRLEPAQSISLHVNNLKAIYLLVTVAGEGFEVIYEK